MRFIRDPINPYPTLVSFQIHVSGKCFLIFIDSVDPLLGGETESNTSPLRLGRADMGAGAAFISIGILPGRPPNVLRQTDPFVKIN